MSLNDKIRLEYGEYRFKAEDVKEFIRKLKEEILCWNDQANYIINLIDELAGKELTEDKENGR